MGGCGRVEILRCVKGLKPGMAEWYVKFVDFKVENIHQSDLLVYITKRRTVKRRQRYVETRDFRVLLDVGSGGRCKGPGARGITGCIEDPSWKAFTDAGWEIRFLDDFLNRGVLKGANPNFYGMVESIGESLRESVSE